MNKEDLTKGIDKLNETFKMNDDNLVLNNYERQRLFKLAYDMQIKINYLQTKIDKTLAYIKSHKSYWEEWHYDNCGVDDDIEEIIKILKGEE